MCSCFDRYSPTQEEITSQLLCICIQTTVLCGAEEGIMGQVDLWKAKQVFKDCWKLVDIMKMNQSISFFDTLLVQGYSQLGLGSYNVVMSIIG